MIFLPQLWINIIIKALCTQFQIIALLQMILQNILEILYIS